MFGVTLLLHSDTTDFGEKNYSSGVERRKSTGELLGRQLIGFTSGSCLDPSHDVL